MTASAPVKTFFIRFNLLSYFFCLIAPSSVMSLEAYPVGLREDSPRVSINYNINAKLSLIRKITKDTCFFKLFFRSDEILH
jgi:hypothetical protein